ncbi:PstS family phosphate ABC transporter substrate-binding protein [Endozoicomonas sp. G2_2]|uniref:PstS family phosphate ABC transporter substrate-binding protein n=1 Tax=Endozoicomonas sp. G2_2 TaxID=2821092 RepID=UPI001AD9B660|nr:PstS family phosphate ABC transporter substrate-binding protein [Endozoicomonas sp. G2_2]MBO9468969.1 PstS family phosphate ABC transporter substrate-binding protein [Endozoicomonas sp. G2_2]
MKLRLQHSLGVAAVAVGSLAAIGTAQAAEQIRIVGSSTVYPFSSYVAEELGATSDIRTPVVESTGSGGGMKLFCGGVGDNTPDITNASRRMKPSEFQMCQDNGVTDITENVVGFDGIVVAQSKQDDAIDLSREQITLAVAAKVPQDGKLVDNPYTKWSDIDSSLPDREILIYGPPTSSGTRDAFEELVMEHGSENIDGYGEAYTTIRQDGKYVPSGENDNLIVQKLAQNKDAFGVFGFSYLEENRDKIQGAKVDGVEPERDLISSGEYPVSRSLFFYTKNAHIEKVKGMEDYVDMFLSDQMVSDRGYLKNLGLIPLPADRLKAERSEWESRAKLKASDLKG